MRIHVARSVSEMDRLRPEWDFLYAQSPSKTLFQSFAWNRLAAARFAGRESPWIVLAEGDSGMALVPAVITRAGLGFLGEMLFDYRDVLSAGSEDALRTAWLRLVELRLPLTVMAVRGMAARRHWAALDPIDFVPAPQVLRREMNAETFSSVHSRLGRTLRRLAKQGAELCCHNGAAADLIAWIYRQKAAQFNGTANNLFCDPARLEFMVAACGLAPAACEIFTFEAAGRPLAALVTFRDGEVRRFYTIWFHPVWAQYSPGTALLYEVTRRSLADGLDCDYMTGEQPHKMRFASSSVPLFRVNASVDALARMVEREVQSAA